MTNTSDDPSTAWRTKHGEWRFLANGFPDGSHVDRNGRSNNSSHAPILAATVFAGAWRYVGDSPLLAGECGSLFPLPPLYPGTVAQHTLPSHVHKRGAGPGNCIGQAGCQAAQGPGCALPGAPCATCPGHSSDHMALGNWTDGQSIDDVGTWHAAGPERIVDAGNLYAGKDFLDVPTGRRIFNGWLTELPGQPQSMMRVVTYHPALQQLVFSPAKEYEKLHQGAPLAKLQSTPLKAKTLMRIVPHSNNSLAMDVNVSFARPLSSATVGVSICNASTVYVNYVHGAGAVQVGIYDGTVQFPTPAAPKTTGRLHTRADQLQLLPADGEITLRVFVDHSILEVYFSDGCGKRLF